MAFSVGVGESAIAQVPDSTFDAQIPEPIASAPSGAEAAVHAASNVTVLHVNPVAGQDQSGSGDSNAPFRSLTHALQVAQSNTVIVLAAGTYSATNGESFPIQLKSGVTIQGNPENSGQDVIIKGGGTYTSPAFGQQNVTLVGADQSGLTGVTVTNTDPRGYGLWIESTSPIVVNNTFHANGYDGVAVAGRANPMLRSNLFAGNGASGVSLFGQAGGTLRNNTFDSNSFGINIAHQARPILVGNRILRNRDGIVVQDDARPALQVNIIEGQERDGLVAKANAQPNLGTPDQAGGNIFRSNGRLDINAEAVQQPIPAYGSQFTASAARGKIDVTGAIAMNGSGTATAAAAPVTPTNNPFNTTLSEMSRTNQISVTQITPPQTRASSTSTSPTASVSTVQPSQAAQAGTSGGSAQSQANSTRSVPPISAMDAWIQNPSAERPAAVNAALETASANADAGANTESEPEQVAIATPSTTTPPVATPSTATPPVATPSVTPTVEAANPEPAAEDSVTEASTATSAASAQAAVTETAELSVAPAASEPANALARESDSEQSDQMIAIRIPTPTLPTANSIPTVEPAAEPVEPAEPVQAEAAEASTEELTEEPTTAEPVAEASPAASSTRGRSSTPLVTEITIEPRPEPAAAPEAAAEPVAAATTPDAPAAEAEQDDIRLAARPAAESASNSLVTEIEFTAPAPSASTSDSASETGSEPSSTATTAAALQLPAQSPLSVSVENANTGAETGGTEATAISADTPTTAPAEPEAAPLPTITSRVAVNDSTGVPATHTSVDTSATTARSHSQLPAAPANAAATSSETIALATPPQTLTDQAISIPVPQPAAGGTVSPNPSTSGTPDGWPSLLNGRNARQSDTPVAAASPDPTATAAAPSSSTETPAEPETIAAVPNTVRSLEFSVDAGQDTVQNVMPEAVQRDVPASVEPSEPSGPSGPEAAAPAADDNTQATPHRSARDLAVAIADRPFAMRSQSADQAANRSGMSRDTEREFTLAANVASATRATSDITDTTTDTPVDVTVDVTDATASDNASSVREFEFTAPGASSNTATAASTATAPPSTSVTTRREPTLPRLPSRASRQDVLAMTSGARSGSLVSTLATSATSGTETNAVAIPVPAAASASPGTTSTVTTDQAEQIARAIAESEQNALPVPDINIPLARSSVPPVNVSPSATRSPIDPPPPPTRASSLGLGYRLIVDAPSTAEQDRLKEHVRDAFRVQYNGRSMMQAGAFRDRTEASAVMQMLQDSGFNVILTE